MTIFPAEEKKNGCKLQQIKQWFKMFIYQYTINCLKLRAKLSMDSKTTLSIIAFAIIALGIAATTIASPDDSSAQKSCAKKHRSHCKGDHLWYTKKGHYHCYKGEKGCKYFEY